VIPNGVDHLDRVISDTGILKRLALTSGRYVIASGNAQAHKNVALLFKVFADGAMDGLTLVLAGADDRAAFTAAGLSPPAGVIFTGRVSDAALRALYEHAACLAFPSRTEGFGLPPLEAMSLGCPAIVAPCGALPEVCGEAALYAGPDDAAAWASAIRRIVDDGDLRTALKYAGVVRANRYRWSDSARKLLDIIEEIA